MRKQIGSILIVAVMILLVTACGKKSIGDTAGWNVTEYAAMEDILGIYEIEKDGSEVVATYYVRYLSDDCEVVSYLSIPQECLDNKEAYPCMIFNRGGNREYGMNSWKSIARYAQEFDMVVFASQYLM